MHDNTPPQQRLVIGCDPKFTTNMNRQKMIDECKKKLDFCCEKLGPLGVTCKVNTIFRILGNDAIAQVQQAGLGVFLDGKFFDIENTIKNDLMFWSTFGDTIKICTLAEKIKPKIYSAASQLMSDTIFCPVGPLTDLTNEDFRVWYGSEYDRVRAVKKFLHQSCELKGARGVVCSPLDIKHGPDDLQSKRVIITPGIRRSSDPTDDNSPNAMAPREAIEAGASYLVVGRPVMRASDPVGVATNMIEEINNAS